MPQTATKPKYVVAFRRPVKRGMRGPDVRAIKRALARRKLLQWGKGFSPLFGPFAIKALKKFQKRVGLRPDGEYGPRTHNALVRAGGFDAYGAKLMASVKVTTDEERLRSMIVNAAFYCYARRENIHYTQGAMRMQGVRQRIRLPNYPRWEDCIAAGTLVSLKCGDVPIEEVRPGDMALTRSGYRRVLDAWLVREDAEVEAVPLADGRTLVGTPEHRVWTENRGWAELRTVGPDDMLRGCEQGNLAPRKSSNTAAIDSGAIQKPPYATSACTSTAARLATSIGSSGRRRTDRFRPITKFTTRMGIRSTTSRRTSFASLVRSIGDSLKIAASSAFTLATSAAPSSSPELALAGSIGSARTRAVTRLITVATRSSEHAPSAGTHSPRISTDRRRTARTDVTRPLGDARRAGRSNVYDLTVEDEHEFFANGVLVHNCSSWATWLYWQAGVKRDPNGLGYNGFGYTGTLSRNGRMTSNPEPGDLVFYGPSPHRHVAVYVGGGRAIGHGSESGPNLLPVHYRSDFSHYRSYL